MVVLGITSFLSSTSRIPITACVFAVEALGGINNILPIIIAATVSMLIVEMSGLEDFTDTVIEAKVHAITQGKKPTVIEVPLTVQKKSFAVGKEARDILWPNECVVVSFEKADTQRASRFSVGDVITVRYKTYHPDITADEIKALVGEQSEETNLIMQGYSE
jgi:CIC family chloride channel protein